MLSQHLIKHLLTNVSKVSWVSQMSTVSRESEVSKVSEVSMVWGDWSVWGDCTIVMVTWGNNQVKIAWSTNLVRMEANLCDCITNSSLCNILFHSPLYNWSATCRRQPCKWRQSGDLSEQFVGHCVWWLLGNSWCYCGVQTTWLLYWRLKIE